MGLNANDTLLGEVGTEKYGEEEMARYTRPEWGHPLFRDARRCNMGRTAVDQD